jgi:hypothetical protein
MGAGLKSEFQILVDICRRLEEYPGVSVLMDERLLIDSCLAQRPGVFGTPVMLLNVADYVAEFCNLNELVWGILVFLKLTCIPILESIPQSGPWL